MKKMLILVFVLGFGLSSLADIATNRLWTSLFIDVPNAIGGEANDDGIGWWTEIWNATAGAATAGNTTANIGWLDGFGYGINTFQFSATEEDIVSMILYNDANPSSATFKLISLPQQLTNLDNTVPPGLNDLNVTFSFTGQSWQAVPEPATALLFGIGGMGAWVVRRNKLKSKEQADA